MARLSDEFIRAARRSPRKLNEIATEAGFGVTHFFQFMPRRRAMRMGFRSGRKPKRVRGHIGEAPKKIPRARWSKVRAKILVMATILKVPPSRVFVEDD